MGPLMVIKMAGLMVYFLDNQLDLLMVKYLEIYLEIYMESHFGLML